MMATSRIVKHTAYLVVSRSGEMRVRRRRPYLHDLGPAEYAFEVTVSVPIVARPEIAGSVEVVLPPDVDGDARAAVEAAGPIAGPGERDARDAFEDGAWDASHADALREQVAT
jgi:hypothetical protein